MYAAIDVSSKISCFEGTRVTEDVSAMDEVGVVLGDVRSEQKTGGVAYLDRLVLAGAEEAMVSDLTSPFVRRVNPSAKPIPRLAATSTPTAMMRAINVLRDLYTDRLRWRVSCSLLLIEPLMTASGGQQS